MAAPRSSLNYSVPAEAHKLLREGLLENELHRNIPPEYRSFADLVHFEGSDLPSLPINYRFAESIAALKGLQAVLLSALLKSKYGVEPANVTINTDHAQLFLFSTFILEIDPQVTGDIVAEDLLSIQRKRGKYFPDYDFHKMGSSIFRQCVTNIYQTKDNRFYHLHGSMNPNPCLDALGFPHDRDEVTNMEDGWKIFSDKIREYDSLEVESLCNDQYRQAGTIAWTPEEYRNSEHGKANAHVGLYQTHRHLEPELPKTWWKGSPQTSPERPLAGLKVLDLTRIIAGPAVARDLAELGASVMRITAPHIADFSGMHADLNWGKWNAQLDLRQAKDRDTLKELLAESDVFIDGYRPGVMEKHGFGKDAVLQEAKKRGRGIIYLRENCYGWSGPWALRSGWQNISDVNTGVSYGFGRAMGNDEPVVPVLPNSDYCTGVAGASAVIQALIERAQYGGSYSIDLSLNYYNRWLTDFVGTYPEDIWDDVWSRNGREVFRHWHSMVYTIPRLLKSVIKSSGHVVFKPEFFEVRKSGAIDARIKCVKPILSYPNGPIRPGFNIGTRGNGRDQPHWPEDLMTEVVT